MSIYSYIHNIPVYKRVMVCHRSMDKQTSTNTHHIHTTYTIIYESSYIYLSGSVAVVILVGGRAPEYGTHEVVVQATVYTSI